MYTHGRISSIHRCLFPSLSLSCVFTHSLCVQREGSSPDASATEHDTDALEAARRSFFSRVRALFLKRRGLDRLRGHNSTGPFGNWGIFSAVSLLASKCVRVRQQAVGSEKWVGITIDP